MYGAKVDWDEEGQLRTTKLMRQLEEGVLISA